MDFKNGSQQEFGAFLPFMPQGYHVFDKITWIDI